MFVFLIIENTQISTYGEIFLYFKKILTYQQKKQQHIISLIPEIA